MGSHAVAQRPFPAVTIVTVLFLLCVIADQMWVANLLPSISGLAGISLSVVFLDIPIPLPVVDVILVPGMLLLIYPIVVLFYPSRTGISAWRQAILRARSVFVGLFVLLLSIISGGWIYYLAQDYFSRRVRNGINSFGINADIHLSYPGYETIHLRGSTIIMVCFAIGLWICIRKIRKEPGKQKAARLTREQRMTPYERMMQEKRMKEKQNPAPALAKPTVNRRPAGTAVAAKLPDRSERPGLCCNQPVMTLRPEPVSYMPMS